MNKRTDQEEFYYQAGIARRARKLLDKIKREVEASPFSYTRADALVFALMIVSILISIVGCLRAVFRF